MTHIHFRTVDAYLALCRHYGWKPTFAGLKAFARGDRDRLLGR